MGRGTEYKCNKCGYGFITHSGVGMLFPAQYEQTVNKAKAGDLGEEIKRFFEEHPDDLVKIIGLYTYQKSPERRYDVKIKDDKIEINGVRFGEFVIEGRKE